MGGPALFFAITFADGNLPGMGMGLEKLLGKRIRKRMGKGRKEQERRRKEMGKREGQGEVEREIVRYLFPYTVFSRRYGVQ